MAASASFPSVFKLSERMQAIYDQLLPGKPVWDFCCDHGYLGIHALKSGQFPEVHFVDQATHLVHRLEKLWIEKRDQTPKHVEAYFHSCAGEKLETLVDGNVVIAGVGTHTIVHILSEVLAKNLLTAQRLILCSQRDEELLKETFCGLEALRSAYNYTNEVEILERSRIRKVLIFDRKGT